MSETNRRYRLPAIDDESGLARAVIEAPRGSSVKYKFDERLNEFVVNKVLPLGAAYPFNYGFIPSTRGDDGDPLDILILMDDAAAVGAILPVRVIGMIEAQQTERSGKTVENARLLSVLETVYNPPRFRSIDDVEANILNEIQHFFISFNEAEGRKFEATGRSGPEQALAMIEKHRE
jgi:inorganic pyrophosphatase